MAVYSSSRTALTSVVMRSKGTATPAGGPGAASGLRCATKSSRDLLTRFRCSVADALPANHSRAVRNCSVRRGSSSWSSSVVTGVRSGPAAACSASTASSDR